MIRRAVISLAITFLIIALLVFVPVRLRWANGWLFLGVFLVEILVSALILCRTNPAIFAARSKIHRGTKWWDKIFLVLLMLSFGSIFLVAGLDRSHVSPWLGYALLTIGMAIMTWVESVNRYAEPSVRIQPGQEVVDRGPYAIVRHPMYGGSVLFFAGTALSLGSLWALIPAGVASAVLVVRTVLEDRTLREELPGYKEYALRVRYRLVPGVW